MITAKQITKPNQTRQNRNNICTHTHTQAVDMRKKMERKRLKANNNINNSTLPRRRRKKTKPTSSTKSPSLAQIYFVEHYIHMIRTQQRNILWIWLFSRLVYDYQWVDWPYLGGYSLLTLKLNVFGLANSNTKSVSSYYQNGKRTFSSRRIIANEWLFRVWGPVFVCVCVFSELVNLII